VYVKIIASGAECNCINAATALDATMTQYESSLFYFKYQKLMCVSNLFIEELLLDWYCEYTDHETAYPQWLCVFREQKINGSGAGWPHDVKDGSGCKWDGMPNYPPTMENCVTEHGFVKGGGCLP
jgi:hypothetical protein